MNRVPIFWITVTATLFVGLVYSVNSLITNKAEADVHRWEIISDGKIVLEPDFSEVGTDSALYVLVFGDDVRDDWIWTERSVIRVGIEEYGYENVSDTRWCAKQRIPLAELRDAFACDLYLTWQFGVSGAPRIGGALPDLPPDYRVELIAIPVGLVRDLDDGLVLSWFLGIGYLVGCFVTLTSVKKRRKRAAP